MCRVISTPVQMFVFVFWGVGIVYVLCWKHKWFEWKCGYWFITRGDLSADVYKVIILNNCWQKADASHDQRLDLVGMFNESACNIEKMSQCNQVWHVSCIRLIWYLYLYLLTLQSNMHNAKRVCSGYLYRTVQKYAVISIWIHIISIMLYVRTSDHLITTVHHPGRDMAQW